MKGLIFQLTQFFKPFPAVDSWAYNLQVKRYDREMEKKSPTLKKDLATISKNTERIATAQYEILKATHEIQLCLCRMAEKENADEDSDSGKAFAGIDWTHGPDNAVLDWGVINPYVGSKPFIPGIDTTADPSGSALNEFGDSGPPE